MQIEQCNKITLDADGTLPDAYLAQERAWAFANKPPFADIRQAALIDHVTKFDPNLFPLPVYQIFEVGPGFGAPGPEQFIADCATLSDGSLLFGSIISPQNMPDRANVTADNLPILHFNYPQAAYEYVKKNEALCNQLDACNTGILASPAEALDYFSHPEKMADLQVLEIWTVAPIDEKANDQIAALDPSLQPLKKIIQGNSGYENPDAPAGYPGFLDVSDDLVQYIANNNGVNKLPIANRLSNIAIPVVAVVFIK